jgi:hypothetical protein
MQGIRTLKSVTEGLRAIDLPPLRRPLVRPSDPKTEELVGWGICMFVYPMIAQTRKILIGLVQLAEAENVAASAPLCRHVFEWTALSCYLKGQLTDQFKEQDWEEAWNLLTTVALGSSWNQKYGSKYAGDPPNSIPIMIPQPIHVRDAVAEYEKYQSQNSRDAEARDSYSLLCEFTHPNAACLLPYYQYEENEAVTRFIDPDHDPQRGSFLPFVNCCLIDMLTFCCELLELAGEIEVRPSQRYLKF